MLRSWYLQAALAVGLAGLTALAVGVLARRPLIRLGTGLPPATHRVGARTEHWVPMRDGVRLATTVTLPEGEGPWPTVILRNPYDLFDGFTLVCEQFAADGYACVHQDVRGRMGSEGDWYPLIHEREDGLDTFAWLREQEFQNGRWALWGMSYLAGVQWAVADALPPEVKTLVSMVFGVDSPSVLYEGGLFRHDVFTAWAALMPDRRLALENGLAYARMLRHRPALDADLAHLGVELPWYRSWLLADDPADPLWTQPPFAHFYATPTRVEVPVLMLGAWYDPFFDTQRRDFARLATRARSKLVVGPWNHVQGTAADFPLPEDLGIGGQLLLTKDWLDHHLRGAPLHQAVGVVELYDLGAGGWRRDFAVPEDRPRRLVLALDDDDGRCPGRLESVDGAVPPSSSDRVLGRYVYDPEDPTPSLGGAAALAFAIPTFPGIRPGARRQPDPCFRDDVLTFISEPLDGPVLLSGQPRARLEVRTTAPDTAFGFELMVKPPGAGAWLHVREAYTALSARPGHRRGPPGPETVSEVELTAWPIEWRLPRGSRIRVDVRSASFPLYAAHPNRRGPWARIEDTAPATQTLLDGSHVTLPHRGSDEPVLSGSALGRVRAAMACTFDIPLTESADVLVDRARKMVADAGGSFDGDTSSGTIKIKLPAVGTVEGNYRVDGTAIHFDITKKPMLVPCSTIESFVKERLEAS